MLDSIQRPAYSQQASAPLRCRLFFEVDGEVYYINRSTAIWNEDEEHKNSSSFLFLIWT
jgi:hypothetical protein